MKKGSRKKILINGLSAVWGGGVVYLRHLLSHYAGHIHFIANQQNRKDFEKLTEEFSNISVHWFETSHYWQKVYFYFFTLPELCRKLEIDVLYEPANFFYRKPTGVRVILNIQNLAPFFKHARMQKQRWNWKLRWALLRFLTYRSIRQSDRVVFISRYSFNLLKSCVPELKHKFFNEIVYHGIPRQEETKPSDFKNFLHAREISEQFLFTPAHLLWYKNIESVILALPRVFKAQPQLHYVVAGNFTTPDYYDYLVKLVRELNLDKKVHFSGEVTRTVLCDLYRNCKLMIFPSLIENMPFTLLESLSFGCVIVAADNAVIPEVVKNSALLVPPTSPGDYAGAILKLLSDEKLMCDYKNKARERAGDFSWARSAKLLQRALTEF
ncbi:glycosyltransferase family 4 protein [Candidatus Riflebacteria bacterium]